MFPANSDDYGIDWEGPVSIDNDHEDNIDVAITNCPLNQTESNDVKRLVDESGYSVTSTTPWENVRCYLMVRDFVKNCI